MRADLRRSIQQPGSRDGELGYVWNGGDVFCALRRMPDGKLSVTYRGSTTAEDWKRDFDPLPVWDPEVGYCHGGFLEGIDASLAEIIPALGTDPHTSLTLDGHSLGAAHARIAAAKLTVRGIKVDQLCTFGSPRPGYVNIRRVIEKSGMVHRSFKYRNDPVCDVPIPIPILYPVVHTEDATPLDGPSNSEDPWGPLRDHHIQLYLAAAPDQ